MGTGVRGEGCQPRPSPATNLTPDARVQRSPSFPAPACPPSSSAGPHARATPGVDDIRPPKSFSFPPPPLLGALGSSRLSTPCDRKASGHLRPRHLSKPQQPRGARAGLRAPGPSAANTWAPSPRCPRAAATCSQTLRDPGPPRARERGPTEVRGLGSAGDSRGSASPGNRAEGAGLPDSTTHGDALPAPTDCGLPGGK